MTKRAFLLAAGLLCGAALIGAEPAPLPVPPLVLRPVLAGHLPVWDIKSGGIPVIGSGAGGGVTAGSGDAVLTLSTQGFVVRTGTNTYITRSLAADTGVTISNTDGVSGNPTIGVDTTVVPFFSTGASDPSANCTVGTTVFTQTTDHTVWFCNNTNTWALMSNGNNFTQFGGPTTARKTFTLPDASATILTSNAVVTVAQGGTGLGSGTSGGVLGYTASGTLASSAALTQHGVVVGGGAGVVPTSTAAGTSGQVLTSNGAAADPTFQAASSTNPLTTMDVIEDFCGGSDSTTTAGTNGVLMTAIATGTAAHSAGTQNNPCLMRMNSHATNDNSGELITLTFLSTTGVASTTWANANWTWEAVFEPGSNSTAITNTAVFFGLANNVTDPAADSACVWIRHDSDLSDTTFVFVVGNASGAAGCNSAGDNTNVKTVASTITPSAGTFYHFKIRRLTSGVGGNPTLYFSVNDETEKTFCTSGCDDTLAFLSSGNYAAFISYLTRTTTGVMSGDLDYLRLQIPVTRY